ncbi:MAG: hypothetical protein CL823_07205 [Crocinitomicaceae bacterium]|nr:hypothetical protein [Crocinitomicaceae bacterium]
MKYSNSFLIFRRRLSKVILKIMGWKFRGQDPPASKRQIIFVNTLSTNKKWWMRQLTATESHFVDIKDKDNFLEKFNSQVTLLVIWSKDLSPSYLKNLFEIATEKEAKISACAWDTTHKAIKFHSQFKPSPYSERDIRYLERFFVFFKKV